MTRARSLLFPALIVGLVALAAFGVRQVIVGQEATDPPFPLTAEEAQRVSQSQFESDEQGADLLGRVMSWNDERSQLAIQQFIDSGGDVCSLPLAELLGDLWLMYPDVRALINDANVIVTGQLVGTFLEAPAPDGFLGASRIVTTVQVDEVLRGASPGPAFSLASVQAVLLEGTALMRVASSGLDSCTASPGPVLLFLESTAEPGVFSVGYQGWAHLEGGAVEAAQYNEIFQSYASAQDLVASVRQIAQEQEAQGLPKGLLRCRYVWGPLNVCPGDTFNPFQVLGLDSATNARIYALLPGPDGRMPDSTDLKPGPQLSALLGTLDVQVTVKPLGLPPADLIELDLFISEPVGGRSAFALKYSPSTGVIQMPRSSGGQFSAPPEFQQAMEPFLAPQ